MSSEAKKSGTFLNEGTGRIEILDGIKGVLIFLVVFGHLIRGKTSYEPNIYGYLHYFIYSIHMPAFIFISGLVSKKKADIRKIIIYILLPYLLVNIAVNLVLVMTKQDLTGQ